jgi:hypothetical protein
MYQGTELELKQSDDLAVDNFETIAPAGWR